MIDEMLEEEVNGKAIYIAAEAIKSHFSSNSQNSPKDTSNNSL
jgi:hypothetical protein